MPSPERLEEAYQNLGAEKFRVREEPQRFVVESTSGRHGKVVDGGQVFHGKDGEGGDQRLVLLAEEWPGRKDFGDSFRISAKTSATPGNPSAWHLGISIGKVRVLYHPGFWGGEFRFEEAGTLPYLIQNEEMGFTPDFDTEQWMSVEVHRFKNGRVSLEAPPFLPLSDPFNGSLQRPTQEAISCYGMAFPTRRL